MTKRTAGLLTILAALTIALLSTDWHPVRACLYLLGWVAVAALLTWNDRRTSEIGARGPA
ncbi:MULTISPECIES: hypothetical protein [Nocardia]|uniref:Uncharacterized protein n=1 Tax=Nocardia aurea TaxID=2144174 RepID=A0ABV3FW28_9NOCA|nr:MULTISPECIES: hypothetical protein [Nocardia]